MKTTLSSALALASLAVATSAFAGSWSFSDYGAGDVGSPGAIFQSSSGQNAYAVSIGQCSGSGAGSACGLGTSPDLYYRQGTPSGLGLSFPAADNGIAATYGVLFTLADAGGNPTTGNYTYRLTLAGLRGGNSAEIVEYKVDPSTGDITLVSVLDTLTGGADVQTTPGLTLSSPSSDVIGVVETNGDSVIESLSVSSPASVPEPATLSLLGIGVLGLAARRRQRTA